MAREACADGGLHQVGVVSMGQIHLLVLCKPAIAEFVSEVETGSVPTASTCNPTDTSLQPHRYQPATPLAAARIPPRARVPPQVPTGVGGVGTNKGGVAVSFRVCSSHLCFVNSHLAAHEGDHHVRQRNANAADISQHLSVGKVRRVVQLHRALHSALRRALRSALHSALRSALRSAVRGASHRAPASTRYHAVRQVGSSARRMGLADRFSHLFWCRSKCSHSKCSCSRLFWCRGKYSHNTAPTRRNMHCAPRTTHRAMPRAGAVT